MLPASTLVPAALDVVDAAVAAGAVEVTHEPAAWLPLLLPPLPESLAHPASARTPANAVATSVVLRTLPYSLPAVFQRTQKRPGVDCRARLANRTGLCAKRPSMRPHVTEMFVCALAPQSTRYGELLNLRQVSCATRSVSGRSHRRTRG